MSRPVSLWAHVHVSEREVAHHWPDGQFDNGAWEDCTFDSGTMLARVAHDAGIPATHVESEHCRDDAGEDPSGGTGAGDLVRGFTRRYEWSPSIVNGFGALWTALTPGHVAAAQGSMGAFAVGDPLRRFQPGFNGAHCVFVARVDISDRVWADDPLAPLGSYQGEWWSKDELRRYVDKLAQQFTPQAVVGRILPEPTQLPDTATSVSRVRVIGAWWDYRVSGSRASGYSASRIQRTTAGFTAEISTITPETTWGGSKRRWAKVSSGAYIGRWVDLNDGPNVKQLAA